MWEDKLRDKLVKWNKEDLNRTLKIGHYHVLEQFISKTISQEKEKMIEAQKTIILFQKAGQCSSLHKAHVNNEYDNGWNCAVNAMLHYLKQPTLEEYQKAINLLQNK